MVTNINLVSPDSGSKSIFSGKATLVLSISLVFLVLVAYGAIYIVTKNYSSKRAAFESEIQLENAKMMSPEYASMADFQEKATLLGKIVDDHAYWDNYLKELSKFVLPEIRFSKIMGNEKGNDLAIKGIATNFDSLSKGMILLQRFPGISSIEFKRAAEKSGSDGSQSGIEFDLTAAVNADFLEGNPAGTQ